MDQQLLEQVETVQKYLATLFDCLPQIHINQYYESTSSIEFQNEILKQNVSYGKKIIQLSDKFTAKYRKDHFVDRKDIEQKILQIFQYFCPTTFSNNLDDMVTAILSKLQEGTFTNFQSHSRSSHGYPMQLNNNSRTNSINNLNQYGKDSKVQFYRDEAEINYVRYQSSEPLRGQNINNKQMMTRSKVTLENVPLQTVESQQMRRKRSNNKSKMSKSSGNQQSTKQKNDEDINWGTKTVLQIKTYFQEQQLIIRRMFQKLNKIIGDKNSVKISEENRQYTKLVNDAEKDNIKDFVHANIQNNKFNLNKFHDFIQLLQEHFEKKNKFQGLAQGKFTTYIEEINKRQELFSFTVSKLLQNLAVLRQSIETKIYINKSQHQEEEDNPLLILDSLLQISHNFYNLYPSHSLLKDLKIQSSMKGSHAGIIESVSFPYGQKQLQKIGYKSEGIQVSIGVSKNEKLIHKQMAESKRNLLQLFKANARVNEMIQKFERSIKYKKNVELKEIEKFIECIKDIFTKKSSHNSANIHQSIAKQAGVYQEELKKIIQNNQKNQKQLSEQYSKKCKKYQKQIQQLQKSIEQLITENKKQQQKLESNIRKQTKKLETEKQESKKILTLKNSLERNIKEMSLQMDRLQRDIRQQYSNFEASQKALVGQNANLSECIGKIEGQKEDVRRKWSEESKKFEEQREIYQKKIIFLESQQEERIEETSQIRDELQQMLKNNKILKKQIQQLTEVYEEKIKQLEELIENIKQLQDELKNRNLQNLELKEKNRINEQIMGNLERENNRVTKQMVKLQEKCKERQFEAQKFKEVGVLNQSDINILKQQMDKVKEAYVQSQDQLDEMRQYVSQIQSQKDFILRQNRNFRKQIQNYNQRIEHEQIIREKLQKEARANLDEVIIKKKQLSHYVIQAQDGKKQISKLRKQLNEIRQSAIKYQNQFRAARQQLQKKTQSESIQSGRRKLQLEAAKVELRRKSEQIQKMKENYDQKIEMLESKNKQLTQFITQKQLLAKITTSHLSQ